MISTLMTRSARFSYQDQKRLGKQVINIDHKVKSLALLRTIKADKKGKGSEYVATELFNNEQIKVKKNVEFDIWDLGGKLPHLWTHHFLGT